MTYKIQINDKQKNLLIYILRNAVMDSMNDDDICGLLSHVIQEVDSNVKPVDTYYDYE